MQVWSWSREWLKRVYQAFPVSSLMTEALPPATIRVHLVKLQARNQLQIMAVMHCKSLVRASAKKEFEAVRMSQLT